jgi:hypothetical protein
MFEDWQKYPHCEISPDLLWEYDIASPEWNWNYMSVLVVQRVIERGRKDDYYAMFQRYGGFDEVRKIAVRIPKLSPIDANWVCCLFDLKKQDLSCYTRMLSRKRLFNC